MIQYRLGSLLINKGIIQSSQLDEALEYQRSQESMPLGAALIALGHVTEKQIAKTLRSQSRIRICAAFVAFLMAPFNWCHASEDEIEHLPEYQYTQVHDQFYYDDEASAYSQNLGYGSLDLLQVTSSAAWYLYKGDASIERMKDMPVKLNISAVQGRDFKLQLSIDF